MKRQADKKVRAWPQPGDLKPGTYVYVRFEHLSIPIKSAMPSHKQRPIFIRVKLVRSIRESTKDGRVVTPAEAEKMIQREAETENQEYEVESVLRHRRRGKKVEYLCSSASSRAQAPISHTGRDGAYLHYQWGEPRKPTG